MEAKLQEFLRLSFVKKDGDGYTCHCSSSHRYDNKTLIKQHLKTNPKRHQISVEKWNESVKNSRFARQIRELTEEVDSLRLKLRKSEDKNNQLSSKIEELERELITLRTNFEAEKMAQVITRQRERDFRSEVANICTMLHNLTENTDF